MNIISKIYAADPWSDLKTPVSSDLSSWEGLLRKFYQLFDFFIPFSAVVAVIMIIVGGYSLMTAMGDPDKIKKGQGIITAAVVGMVIVFLARLLVKFIIELL
jgi:type IV secretory pathway VirB2 component (pilin)